MARVPHPRMLRGSVAVLTRTMQRTLRQHPFPQRSHTCPHPRAHNSTPYPPGAPRPGGGTHPYTKPYTGTNRPFITPPPPMPAMSPQVLRDQAAVVTRTYKLLSSLARAHHPAKGPAAPPPPPLSRPFQELVGFVHRELTPAVYTAIGDEVNANGGAGAGAGGGEGGEEGGAVRLSRAKLRQDAKAIPQLIFQVGGGAEGKLTEQ